MLILKSLVKYIKFVTLYKILFQIREAAQALLLAELERMGPKGRKTLVDSWSQYLPMYSTQEPIAPQSQNQSPPAPGSPVPPSESNPEEEDEEEELVEGEISIKFYLLEFSLKKSILIILHIYISRNKYNTKTIERGRVETKADNGSGIIRCNRCRIWARCYYYKSEKR